MSDEYYVKVFLRKNPSIRWDHPHAWECVECQKTFDGDTIWGTQGTEFRLCSSCLSKDVHLNGLNIQSVEMLPPMREIRKAINL